MEVVFVIVGVLVVLHLPLIMLIWRIKAIRDGLKARPKKKWLIKNYGNRIVIETRFRTMEFDISQIKWAKLAYNDNWTESVTLDDGITLYNSKKKKMIKIPMSSIGAQRVLHLLYQNEICTYTLFIRL